MYNPNPQKAYPNDKSQDQMPWLEPGPEGPAPQRDPAPCLLRGRPWVHQQGTPPTQMLRAVGDDHCDTTKWASQRLIHHKKGAIPVYHRSGEKPLDPTTLQMLELGWFGWASVQPPNLTVKRTGGLNSQNHNHQFRETCHHAPLQNVQIGKHHMPTIPTTIFHVLPLLILNMVQT